MTDEELIIGQIRSRATPLVNMRSLAKLYELLEKKRVVVLGSASCGSHEFNQWRVEITKYLISRARFGCLIWENDWQSTRELDRYIAGRGGRGKGGQEALKAFRRWPSWPWANEEVKDLVEWLRDHNRNLEDKEKINILGLDIYNFWRTVEVVTGFIKKSNQDSVDRMNRAFFAFEPYGRTPDMFTFPYPMVPDYRLKEIIDTLSAMKKSDLETAITVGGDLELELEKPATKKADSFYDIFLRANLDSWNQREKQMFETLKKILKYKGAKAKVIIWAHNSHAGDARASSFGKVGMLSLGQMIREEYADESCLVGMSNFVGEEISSRVLNGPMQKMNIPEARAESWEAIFHKSGLGNLLMVFSDVRARSGPWSKKHLQRGSGIFYESDLDRNFYQSSILARRFDAFLYFERTLSLRPLPVRPLED